MTQDLPLLLGDVLNPVALCLEYQAVCAARGHVEGTSLWAVLEHEWRQGAQAQLLDSGGDV